jgi:hypothetical protein
MIHFSLYDLFARMVVFLSPTNLLLEATTQPLCPEMRVVVIIVWLAEKIRENVHSPLPFLLL